MWCGRVYIGGGEVEFGNWEEEVRVSCVIIKFCRVLF